MSQLVVIADDFTGANDTGVQFATQGASVAVSMTGEMTNHDVTVINTETRATDPDQAGMAVAESVKKLVDSDTRIVFKKIDSTFRGNIGAEITAAAKAFDTPIIIVAAAIPAAGRTTINGCCLVHGVPVAKTEFANDPKTPVRHSSISDIISEQSDLHCISVSLSQIRSEQWGEIFYETPKALIFDCESDADLKIIGRYLATLKKRFVLVGAAGIASALPVECYLPKKFPVLVVAGSMSQVTFEQVNYGAQHGLHLVDIDARSIWLEPDETRHVALNQAKEILQNGAHCALRTMSQDDERERSQRFCEQQHISSTALGSAVAEFLGELSRQLIDEMPLSGVLYTGGDIAIAAARHLQADAYVIDGEIEACIPYGHFTNRNLRVVTKAGGFGGPDAIVTVIRFLQGTS